jgi:serine/threonine protein kinase/tetratricopeptide (TPR) repeat protein
MKPERWRQIDQLFQEAREHPAAERDTLLKVKCAGDESLRKEVESLLSFTDRSHSFLEQPAFEEAAELVCEGQIGSMSGLLIPPYKIEQQLGAGGMGEVYLAENTNTDGKVAIKFLPSYLQADELAKRRLIREAKAAAKLDHPNICAVYDVKEEGEHTFIVMQYVAGQTLAEKMKSEKIELDQTLDIVIQVVEALAEAHSRGIVHRDIKPWNIMISARGQVKVLDFGLAKIVGPTVENSEGFRTSSMVSRPGDRPGTPPYMSPEQARSRSVDARGDLFAVGVILYECSVGRRPFSGKTDKEVLAQVMHFDPPAPSQVNSSLPPELDRIVIKTLAKQRADRYQSAANLLDDLRTLRNQLPGGHRLVTGPLPLTLDSTRPSTLTTLSKVLRQPLVFLSVTAVVLALLVVAYLFIPRPYHPAPQALKWYETGTGALRNGAYFEASKALQQAVAADDKFALAHARLAEAYSELDYSDKAKDEVIRADSHGHEVSLQKSDLLYLRAVTSTVLRDFPSAIESYQQIASQAPDEDRANVYLDLGRAYEKNDELQKARDNYQQATSLAPQTPAALLRLGVVCSVIQDYACAAEAFQKAESLYQGLSNYEGVAEVLYQRSLLFTYQVKLPEAKEQLEKALEMTKATGNQYQMIRGLQLQSTVLALEGHLSQAETQATTAVQLARSNGIETLAAGGLIWLGNAYLMRGDYDDAEKYYQQALELSQRDKMRVNEALTLTQLGSLRSQQHRSAEALQYVEKAIAFYQQNGYRKYLSLTLPLVGRAYRDKGDYEAALKSFEQQINLGEQLGDRAQVGRAHADIGNVLAAEERYPDALRHFDEGYQVLKSLKADSYSASAAQNRASVLWQLGRAEEAKNALDEATSIAAQSENPGDRNKRLLADIHVTRSFLALSEGRVQESKAESQEALDLAGNQYQTVVLQAKDALGLAQSRSGSPRLGILLCEEAVQIATRLGDQQLLSQALLDFAEAALESGDTQRALDSALRAQESFARFGKSDSEWRAWLIAARAEKRLGDANTAGQYAQRAATRLSELEQRWGSEGYNGYLQRSDITHFRQQLEQLKP